MQSQNGWQAFTDYGDPGLTSNPTVPGTDVKILGGLRSGVAATVLLHVARRFHETVEPLVQDKGVWGFGPRTIRGSSTTLSNHASGTAIDLNSAVHPLASTGTFSSSQVVAITAILAEMSGVIRWGGNYNGRKDEMHFEINASEAEVAVVATRLIAGSIPPKPTTPEPTPGGFLMALSDVQQSEIYDTLHDLRTNGVGKGQTTVGGTFAALLNDVQRVYNQNNAIAGDVQKILAEAGVADEIVQRVVTVIRQQAN